MRILYIGPIIKKQKFNSLYIMKTTNKTMNALLVMLLVSFTTMGTDLKVYHNAMAPDFDNIQEALDAAVDGDKIFIDTVTFVGNITIDKSVALYPLHKGGMFTVNGSTALTWADYRNIELHGMNGANVSTSGGINDSATVLINGCYFSSYCYLNSNKLISYVYYSSFSYNLNVNRSELIGNTFNSDVIVNLENTLDFKMKVYGNYFGTSDGISISSAQNCFVHIANNIFNYNSNYDCIYVHGNNYADNVIIENNTLNAYGGSSDIIKCYAISNLIIRNNYFNVSPYGQQDIYTTGILIYEFKNNIVRAYDANFVVGSGSLSTIENNIYSVTPTFSTSTGVISDVAYQNTGADIPECRDIDNTVNDVGTYGGPHSWDNYHSNSNSKAQILDLEIPYYNIILPGNQISIKSKAVHKQ